MTHRQDDNINERRPHRSARRRPPKGQPGTGDGRDVVAFPYRHGEADDSPLHDSPEQALWRYDQPVRGGERHYAGYVTYLGGEEGERRRAELAAVLGELLRWAASPQEPHDPRDHEQDRAA